MSRCCCLGVGSRPAHAQKPNGKISGAATYALTRQLLEVAPKRFNGSPGHLAAENFIKAHFAPEIADHRLEVDSFTASTPAGLQPMHNIIVRYPGKRDGIIVLATHYETNYPLKDIAFYGANDGACTTGAADRDRRVPEEESAAGLQRLPAVLDDGEEAVKEWSSQDSLYGTRHLAAKWSQGRHAGPYQGVSAGGYDRRQAARYRPRCQLLTRALEAAGGGGEEHRGIRRRSRRTTRRSKTIRSHSISAACRCWTSSTTTTARIRMPCRTATITPRRTRWIRSAHSRCRPTGICFWR